MANDGIDLRMTSGLERSSVGLLPYLLLLLFTLAAALAAVGGARRSGRRRAATASAGADASGSCGDEAGANAPAARFADVAGCDEAVEELAETVEFLRAPERFALVDAKMPAGLLLTGPPGTGKTMLARALAGEAGVRFYSASGSEFVEKYVGVGASRVRDLFKRAVANAPAVIFIDEIDAIGSARGGADGNTEREQTLNELLVRMDGFAGRDRVVVVAATNPRSGAAPSGPAVAPDHGRAAVGGRTACDSRRAQRAEAARRRPRSRCDRGDDVRFLGCAARRAAQRSGDHGGTRQPHDDRGRRSSRGPAPRDCRPQAEEPPIGAGELEKIAYHEAGHVVCAELSEHHENAQHVTIDPRGNAMGFALFGQEDRALHDEEHLRDAMVAALGGRAAEQLVFGRVSSGAKNDLEKVNAIARAAVTEYGMSSHIGQFVGDVRRLSNETKALIDREVERLVAGAYAAALALLDVHRRELETLAKRLLEARELERIDIVATLA